MREPSHWLKRCAKGRQHLQEMHAEQDRAHSCRVMLSGTEVAAGTTPSGAEQELQQLPGDRDELNRRKRGHTAKLVGVLVPARLSVRTDLQQRGTGRSDTFIVKLTDLGRKPFRTK